MRRKLFSAIIVALFSLSAYAQPAGWQYNLPIIVTNTNTQLIGYVMPIVINTHALILAGQMQANGSDIRFGTPCTGTKSYGYYIDSGINTTSTLIYVRIDTLEPNQTLNLYMFYGGGPNVAPASTYTILNGPIAMDAPLGTINSFASPFETNETFGAVFTPNQNLVVTQLGKNAYPANLAEPVKLWDAVGGLITQTTVAGPTNTFNYSTLATPIPLFAGKTYTLSTHIISKVKTTIRRRMHIIKSMGAV